MPHFRKEDRQANRIKGIINGYVGVVIVQIKATILSAIRKPSFRPAGNLHQREHDRNLCQYAYRCSEQCLFVQKQTARWGDSPHAPLICLLRSQSITSLRFG